MAQRYFITDGAKTTVGGTVLASTGFRKIEGRAMALEGDNVSCPACGKGGYILCVGPRLSMLVDGKNPALEGDLCVCSCIPPPQLLANQNLSSQTISAEMAAEYSASLVDAIPAVKSEGKLQDEYDQHFQLHDEKGLPVKEAVIDLHLPDGRAITNQTDSHGKSRVVNGSAEHELELNLYKRGDA